MLSLFTADYHFGILNPISMKNILFNPLVNVVSLLLLLSYACDAQTPVTVVIGGAASSSSPNYGPINNGGFLNQI